MKSVLITIVVALGLVPGISTMADARPGCDPRPVIYVSGYQRCGTPIYMIRHVVGYDRCGNAIWRQRVAGRGEIERYRHASPRSRHHRDDPWRCRHGHHDFNDHSRNWSYRQPCNRR